MNATHLIKRNAWLICLIAVLTACAAAEPSDAVKQDRVYTAYDLHYDGNADVTVARASFKFGHALGTQLALADGSSVRFNDAPLSKVVQPVTNITYYERTFPGLVPDGTFTFVDADGTQYENAVALRPITFNDPLPTLHMQTSSEVAWDGAPLAEGEEATIVLYRVLGEAELTWFTQHDTGAQSVILDRGKMQHVQPGEVTLVLERKRTQPLHQATAAGGEIIGRYTPPNAVVQVVDQ